MKNISLLLLAFGFVVSGCSSTPESVSTESAEYQKLADASGYRCQMTIVTGSNFKKRRCTTKVQRDKEEAAAEALFGDLKHPPIAKGDF